MPTREGGHKVKVGHCKKRECPSTLKIAAAPMVVHVTQTGPVRAQLCLLLQSAQQSITLFHRRVYIRWLFVILSEFSTRFRD